jgi:hypothetical protein
MWGQGALQTSGHTAVGAVFCETQWSGGTFTSIRTAVVNREASLVVGWLRRRERLRFPNWPGRGGADHALRTGSAIFLKLDL